LRYHCWTNGLQIHLLCEIQICVITVGLTAYKYTCVKYRFALSQLD